MDQLVPPPLGWSLMIYWVCLLIAVVAIVVAWRNHVDTKAILRRGEANLARDRRLAEIRDRLYLESLPEKSRARELAVRTRLAEHERRAREILGQEEAARGGLDRCAGLSQRPPGTCRWAT